MTFSSLNGADTALKIKTPIQQVLIGNSPLVVGLRRAISVFGPAKNSIFLTGETGTGKSLVAKALHDASSRTGDFISVNCAALVASLFGAELFGHRKGAYTGAYDTRDGLLRSSNKGTIFLDEIGELDQSLQPTLLGGPGNKSRAPGWK